MVSTCFYMYSHVFTNIFLLVFVFSSPLNIFEAWHRRRVQVLQLRRIDRLVWIVAMAGSDHWRDGELVPVVHLVGYHGRFHQQSWEYNGIKPQWLVE